MPGNLCNSYRRGKSKSRGRQLIRGPSGGGEGRGRTARQLANTQIRTNTVSCAYMANTGFDNRTRIRFSVRVPWPYQLHSTRPTTFGISPTSLLLFLFLVQKPQNYIGPGSCRRSWWCCCCPKAKSPQPNLNLSPGLVMLIFNLRLQPNRKLIV